MKVVQGWPKFWANFRALIGIFSQSVGPSLTIWANPVQFSRYRPRTRDLHPLCGLAAERDTGRAYDALGLIGTTFTELDSKTLIVFERAVLISPNAW
jgi:hypothetical protein